MIQAGAYATIQPNFIEPELVIQYSLPSGFTDALSGGELRVRLPEDALVVYMRQVNLRTRMAAGQASFNELPGVNISAQLLQAPTYLFKVRSEFDHHDVAAGANWGINTVEAYRLGMRQGHNQLARDACLKGMMPQNGEGLLNAAGTTTLNLPADSNGHNTVLTYDPGEMGLFLATQIQEIKASTLMMGVGREFCILGPQRTLGPFEYNVVQLTSYQRPGAGSDSTKGMLEAGILMKNGDRLSWSYDDTLIGAGPSGTDIVLIIMPEVAKPAEQSRQVNTNIFGDLAPGNPTCTTQYADMAAPTEIMSPMAGGKTDFMTEWRVTPGWVVRGQAVHIVYMPYP